jgi:hypothetical protein
LEELQSEPLTSSRAATESFNVRPGSAPTYRSQDTIERAFPSSPAIPTPSQRSVTSRRKLSTKDEIELLVQELHEIEQKLRFIRVR